MEDELEELEKAIEEAMGMIERSVPSLLTDYADVLKDQAEDAKLFSRMARLMEPDKIDLTRFPVGTSPDVAVALEAGRMRGISEGLMIAADSLREIAEKTRG
jgi:hypothetical protein